MTWGDVRLTQQEFDDAYRVGLARSDSKNRAFTIHKFDWTPEPSVQRHIDGMSAASEALTAKVLWRRWISNGLVPDRPEDGDVEGGVYVRWTDRKSGSLIVHEDEPNDHPGVLVIGERGSELRVVGWMMLGIAKRSEWWREKVRYPAYFVPQAELNRDFSTFPPRAATK